MTCKGRDNATRHHPGRNRTLHLPNMMQPPSNDREKLALDCIREGRSRVDGVGGTFIDVEGNRGQ